MSAVATGLSVLAMTAGLLRAWPQAARIVVGGTAAGVSAPAWVLACAAGLVWEGIGIVERIPALIVYNILHCAGTLTVLAVLTWRSGPRRIRVGAGAAAGVVAALVAVATGYLVWGRTGVSVLGVAISMVMFLPQAVALLRRPATGVSAVTWWLSLTSATAWGGYGWLTRTAVLIVPNLVMIPTVVVILARVHGGPGRRRAGRASGCAARRAAPP